MKYAIPLFLSLFYGCASTTESIVSTTRDSVSVTYKTVYIPIEQQHYLLGYYWQTPQWEHFRDTANGATADIDRTDPTKPVAYITTPKDSARVVLPEVRHDVTTDTNRTRTIQPSFFDRLLTKFGWLFIGECATLLLIIVFKTFFK